MFIQLIISGILLGGIYALISVGLSLIFGVSKVTNFAHGDFVMVGMYLAYALYTAFNLSPYVSWLIVIPVSAFIGWLFFKLIKYTIGKSDLNQIFLTLGLSFVLQNTILMMFKSDFRSVPQSFDSSLKIGSFFLSYEMLIAFLIAIATTFAFLWFINHTYLGKAMKAVSQDRDAAKLMGIPTKKIDIMVFSLGIAMAGLAGTLLITVYPTNPTIGSGLNLIAWIIVVLGGLGQLGGALLGALLIGVSETLSGFYIGADYRQVVYYIMFIIVLVVRPQGLFTRKGNL